MVEVEIERQTQSCMLLASFVASSYPISIIFEFIWRPTKMPTMLAALALTCLVRGMPLESMYLIGTRSHHLPTYLLPPHQGSTFSTGLMPSSVL